MLLHHIVCSAGFYVGVRYQFGVIYLAIMVQNEVSTPFLNLRFFLAEFGKKKTWYYTLNEVLFCVVFFISRIAMNSGLFWSINANIMLWDFEGNQVSRVMGYSLVILGHVHMVIQL